MTMKEELQHLPNRRDVLVKGTVGALTLVGLGESLEGIVYADTTVTSTPNLEEGPYWVDETGGTFHRSDVRANLDGTNFQAGLPLYFGLTVSQVSNNVVTPLPNAFVYIWSCNASGIYSDEAAEDSASDTYLRGYQVTDKHGNVRFTSIYPSWYSGRTIHIHIRVRIYPDNDPTQTPTYDFETQLFFDDTVSNYIIQNVSPYNTRTNRDTTNTTDRVYSGSSLDSDGVTSNAGALTKLKLALNGVKYAQAAFAMTLNLSLTETTGNGGGTGGGGTGGGGGGMGGPGGGGGMGGPPPGG